MNMPLDRELKVYLHLREKLVAEFPKLDNQTLHDTLEGITSLHEMIAEVIRSALEDQALASGLKTRITEMKSRLDRLQTRASKKRRLAIDVMVEADIKKLAEPDFTASARAGAPSIIITSEDQVPEAFWVPQPSKLDRQALLSALKNGQSIDGAALRNPEPTLSVRAQ